MGKTRVTPIKTTTKTKLGLKAALQASRIKLLILEQHVITIGRVYLWSDPKTVLQWLNAFYKKQQIFVANHIGENLENTKLSDWNHIPGAQNPADLGTRWLKANKIASSVWLNGPTQLRENGAQWPKATTKHYCWENSKTNSSGCTIIAKQANSDSMGEI